MDNYIRAIISELVCLLDRPPGCGEDENDCCGVEVRIRITRTAPSTYVYDYGISDRLLSGVEEVCTTTAQGTLRVQFDVHHGRRIVRVYA